MPETPVERPERPSPRAQAQRQARQLFPCLAVVAGFALVVGVTAWILVRSGTPGPTRAQVRATQEAVQLATSQAERRATVRTSRATTTALARRTVTAEASATEAASQQTAVAATADAEATAKAPPTLTALARAHATAQIQAKATAQVLDAQAALLYGPEAGTLEQIEDEEAPCIAAGVDLRNFVAEVAFHNPQDAGYPAGGAWDYGLVFSNIGEGTEYRVVFDSEGAWIFNLHSPVYDVSYSNTTDLLDTSDSGSNTFKLYVTENTAQLYANGGYVDTFDLVMLSLGQSEGANHDVYVCAGVKEGYTAVGRVTPYEEFRVWSLP